MNHYLLVINRYIINNETLGLAGCGVGGTPAKIIFKNKKIM
jgi:hypothetical protein